MTLATDLAEFCLTEIPRHLTPSVETDFRRLLLDYCGVALGGSATDSSRIMRSAMMRSLPAGGGLQASVVGGEKCWAPVAAMLNGAAAHSIELDDLHSVSSFHPGAIIYPAALAMAEAKGSDGKRFMHAVVAGYEAAVRVGLWITPSELFSRGLHPTGVLGSYGAATAAAVILELDETKLAKIYGIAADLSTGFMEFNQSGSWSKRMHTGWPAHAGLIAALLGAEGFEGSAGIFEAPTGVIFAGSGRRTPIAAGDFKSDGPLAIEQIAIKRHACCRFGHGALDILLDLKAKHRLDPVQIKSVKVGMFRDGMFLGGQTPNKLAPQSTVDAQFSLYYQVASALVRGHVSLADFMPAAIADPQISAFIPRITVEQRADLDTMFPAKYGSDVEIVLTSGERLHEVRDYIVGDPDHPLTDQALDEKFTSLLALAIPGGDKKVSAAIKNIMTPPGPRALVEVMTAAVAGGDPGSAATAKALEPT
jgi:2-methylcitrate dehydratase PrpD